MLRRLQRQGAVLDSFRIRHDDKTEAILQIADLLAGAGSDWLCDVSRDARARIGHCVRAIPTVFDNRPQTRRGPGTAIRSRSGAYFQ